MSNLENALNKTRIYLIVFDIFKTMIDSFHYKPFLRNSESDPHVEKRCI